MQHDHWHANGCTWGDHARLQWSTDLLSPIYWIVDHAKITGQAEHVRCTHDGSQW